MGHEVIEMELEDLLLWITIVLAKERGRTEELECKVICRIDSCMYRFIIIVKGARPGDKNAYDVCLVLKRVRSRSEI